MSRRKAAPKRAILPDPLFKSVLLAKFINSVMKNGKKSLSESIVYGSLQIVVEKLANKLQVLYGDQGGSGDDGESGGSATKLKPSDTDIRTSEAARKVALDAFKKALLNVTPTVEVKSRRVGGSTYQVPMEIREVRRRTLAMRWLTDFATKRGEKTMVLRLANEIVDAIEDRGGAVRKREDVHRMAKANQAFAHYRW